MANVILDDTHLTNIANAIREKNGEATTYTPGAMAKAITDLPSGGSVEVEPIVLTGSCKYACSEAIPSSYIKLFGDTITTDKVGATDYMFSHYKNENIPFEINCDNSSYQTMTYMFSSAAALKEVPKINNAYPGNLTSFFSGCRNIRSIPDDFCDSWNFSRVRSYTYGSCSGIFNGCSSLRKISTKFLQNMRGEQTTASYNFYSSAFNGCESLDEINGLAFISTIFNGTYTATANLFTNTINNCFRLKDFTFNVSSVGVLEAKWKNQTIDFSVGVGYSTNSSSNITLYNSGITADKEVVDDATYQALKNDADWFTHDINYSRYNHDSAVNTINSLPDTSDFLATSSGTNTIKFKGAAGALTDGGAINTLTEEEIAVATAKGWTVSLV